MILLCDDCKISNSIGYETKALNQLIQRRMVARLSAEGIDTVTVMHSWIIGYLNNNRDKSIYQKDIESEFAISRSTVTNILKLMEKKGYIARVSVEEDARLKKIILTERGVELNSFITRTIKLNEAELNTLISNEERETFLKLIRKLRKKLETV